MSHEFVFSINRAAEQESSWAPVNLILLNDSLCRPSLIVRELAAAYNEVAVNMLNTLNMRKVYKVKINIALGNYRIRFDEMGGV